MGRPIPDIRKDMYDLADRLNSGDEWDRERIATQIRQLADDTHRNAATHSTRPKRRRMTPAIGKAVRAYVMQHPNMNLDEVGLQFNIAGGRVSEAINGKHFDPIVEGLSIRKGDFK